MSVLRSRALLALRTARPTPTTPLRLLSTTPSLLNAKKPISDAPTPVTAPPQFPAPTDPFNPAPKKEASAAAAGAEGEYSESTKTLVRGVARLMGYNTRKSTAIRETGRMMRGVVAAIEKDRAFWYDACALPPTYQTFFQLHLLYVLLLVTRLRALRLSSAPGGPVPDSAEPGTTETEGEGEGGDSPLSLGKPAHESYPTELLSHFFELAESQMRMVLGRGERERTIRKYMDEMGEQWKGAGTGLDYVLGLGMSEVPEDAGRADAELASWLWRNLFASRGLTPDMTTDETAFVDQLAMVVRFVRRELARLDQVPDAEVLEGNIGEWGRVEQ